MTPPTQVRTLRGVLGATLVQWSEQVALGTPSTANIGALSGDITYEFSAQTAFDTDVYLAFGGTLMPGGGYLGDDAFASRRRPRALAAA